MMGKVGCQPASACQVVFERPAAGSGGRIEDKAGVSRWPWVDPPHSCYPGEPTHARATHISQPHKSANPNLLGNRQMLCIFDRVKVLKFSDKLWKLWHFEIWSHLTRFFSRLGRLRGSDWGSPQLAHSCASVQPPIGPSLILKGLRFSGICASLCRHA